MTLASATPAPAAASAPIPWPAWAAVGLLLLGAAIALAWWLRRWARQRRRRRRPRRPEVRARYPLVLCHGLFGFDEIEIAGWRHAYFRGVPARLERSNWRVSLAHVSGAGSLEVRARQLAAYVRTIEAPKVNLIAHSAGGVDARFAVSRLGLEERVASVVTVGTPHHGTPLADLGDGLAARLGLGRVLERVGIGPDVLRDLTVARMKAFNAQVRDAPGVFYGSVVGVARRPLDMNVLLMPSYLWLKRRAGENDGVVPASSQRWGELLARIEADHWAQVGWSLHFDAADFYAWLARDLRGRGL